LAFLDASGIPSELRGYISVAVSKGLLQGDTSFRPNAAFTRADLAHAVAVIQKRATE
jgi:hypothetical protein